MKVDYVPLDPDYPKKIRLLADAIHETLPSTCGRRLVDLGAGSGMLVNRLAELGWDAWGVEGNDRALEEGGYPEGLLLKGDLTTPPPWKPDWYWYDVAVCTEVAEHIPAEHANDFVRTVALSASEWLVWSAAGPGQHWPGHVNLQPRSYWLEELGHYEWRIHATLTNTLRIKMREKDCQHASARENFFVLEKRSCT